MNRKNRDQKSYLTARSYPDIFQLSTHYAKCLETSFYINLSLFFELDKFGELNLSE